MKSQIYSIVFLFAATFASRSKAAEHGAVASTNVVRITPAFISELAEEMRTNNPALRAAHARVRAAAAGVGAVRTWEDPIARLGGMAAREELRASDGDLIYGVEQRLPLFGKPKRTRRVAEAEQSAENAAGDYQFQMLKRELAKAVFQAALAGEVIRIGEKDLAALETLADAVERRYGTGQATLVEVSQAENERAKRANQLETDRNDLLHQEVALNRLLNRHLHMSMPALQLPAPAGEVVYNERLVAFALKYEPKIKWLRQQSKQAEAVVELTRRQRMPDVNVGLEGRNYTGDGSFRQGMLVLSMNLPWVNKSSYLNDIARDEAKLKSVEFDLADYELGVREDVHHLAVKIDAARREALLYRDNVLPRSATALESATSSWETGRGAFRDLLEARRMLLDGQLMYARSVAEQYQMLLELVLCCGLGDLGALQMLNALPKEN